jgi:hypothetical protein
MLRTVRENSKKHNEILRMTVSPLQHFREDLLDEI